MGIRDRVDRLQDILESVDTSEFSRRELLLLGSGVAIGGSSTAYQLTRPKQKSYMVESLPTPVYGDPNSLPIRGWFDYACGHCSKWFGTVFPKLRDQYLDPGFAHLRYNNYPIADISWIGGNIAHAVQHNDSTDHFWDVCLDIHSLDKSRLVNSDNPARFIINEMESETFVSKEHLYYTVEKSLYRPVIKKDYEEAEEVGIPGTPSLLIDGEVLTNPGFEEVADVIERKTDI